MGSGVYHSLYPCSLCCFHCQPRKEDHSHVACTEIFQAEGAVGADGAVDYTVAAAPPGMGQYQLEVRVYPWHPLLTHPLEMGLMKSL